MKEQLLQKLWHQRRLNLHEPETLLKALLLLEKDVIPTYLEIAHELKQKHLTSSNLVSEIQKRFGRLFGPCTEEEEKSLKSLPDRLKKEIKGQEGAIDAIYKALHQWRKIPPLDGKPLVLFFAGSPGVGKSETATKFAYELNSTYGIAETAVKTCESNVKRINLNRQQQGGFIGWDKIKGEILCHLLYAPTSVVILEEWDKMGTEEMSSLLELLDGTPTYLQEPWGYGSTNGPYVDKSCATFILTSNISIGEKDREKTVKEGISNCFSKENGKDAQAFLSRIDAVIPFQEISPKATEELIKEYLDEHVKRGSLSNEKRKTVEESLKKRTTTDARDLQRVVQSAIFEALRS